MSGSLQSCARLAWLLLAWLLVQEAQAARGRPYINAAKTTFVADNGSLLRGAIISTETGASPSVAELQAIKNYGLNAVHCYAERSDYGYSAGARFAAVDLAVQRTRDQNLYLIITVGSGGVNAVFNRAFWEFYAARYAHETHVLYEIQNEPNAGPPSSTAVIDMELTNYAIIRAAAPDTPVLLMSYMIFQNASAVLQDLSALGPAIDWTNAAVAFHGYGEYGPAATKACLRAVLDAGYPCMQTEFYRWPWGLGDFALGSGPSLYEDVDEMGDLERMGVSWLSFLTLRRVTEDFRFKDRIDQAGIRWIPDFGTWPGGTRGTYGNNGEPWSITRSATRRIQAENFDTGGQNVAYNDNSAVNSGGSHRTTEGVEIQTTGDTGGGHNIGWMVAGEWLEYTTYVTDPGRYTLNLRVASSVATGRLRLKHAGRDLTGEWTVPATGGYTTWLTISKTVELIPGQQVLRFEILASGFNLNWIELVPVSTGSLPNGTYQIFNRKSLKAIDIVNASTSNGAKLQQWSYGGGAHQKWVIAHQGANQYTVRGAQSNKAVDVASGTLLSGDNISLWPAKTTAGQRWLFMPVGGGAYKIVAANNGLALMTAGGSTASGARVEQREYSAQPHQEWFVVADHPSTYAAWTALHFPLAADRNNPAVAGPSADPRGHGASNLLRYAFGLSPDDFPAHALPVLTMETNRLALRFRYDPGLTDITYWVEASSDLVDWTETIFDSRLDALPPLVDGWMNITDPVDYRTTSRRFLRLRILMDQ